MSKALQYLATTDEPCANLKAEVARKEYLCKLAESKAFMLADGPIEKRKAEAKSSLPVQEAQDEYFQAIAEFEKVKAKRETESLVCEVWRSLNANRRQGA
jgi:hypothetical protein